MVVALALAAVTVVTRDNPAVAIAAGIAALACLVLGGAAGSGGASP